VVAGFGVVGAGPGGVGAGPGEGRPDMGFGATGRQREEWETAQVKENPN